MYKCLNFDLLAVLKSTRAKSESKNTINVYHDMLVCRLEGSTTLTCEKKRFVAKRGDILYIPKGAKYYHECSEDETVVSIYINVFGPSSKEILLYTPTDPDKICALFDSINDAWCNENKNSSYQAMSILYQILFVSDAFIQLDTPVSSIIQKGIDYIDLHFASLDFTMDKVCQKTNVSRSYFNRVFKKEFGVTPIEYIQKKRIDKAIFLLENGSYSREEIATLCGFKDVKYFYTVFKKITGTSTKNI